MTKILLRAICSMFFISMSGLQLAYGESDKISDTVLSMSGYRYFVPDTQYQITAEHLEKRLFEFIGRVKITEFIGEYRVPSRRLFFFGPNLSGPMQSGGGWGSIIAKPFINYKLYSATVTKVVRGLEKDGETVVLCFLDEDSVHKSGYHLEYGFNVGDEGYFFAIYSTLDSPMAYLKRLPYSTADKKIAYKELRSYLDSILARRNSTKTRIIVPTHISGYYRN